MHERDEHEPIHSLFEGGPKARARKCERLSVAFLPAQNIPDEQSSTTLLVELNARTRNLGVGGGNDASNAFGACTTYVKAS